MVLARRPKRKMVMRGMRPSSRHLIARYGKLMARKKTQGKTASGKPITDDLIDKLAKKAEAGYDVEETLRRRPRAADDRFGSSSGGACPPLTQSCARRLMCVPSATMRPRLLSFASASPVSASWLIRLTRSVASDLRGSVAPQRQRRASGRR